MAMQMLTGTATTVATKVALGVAIGAAAAFAAVSLNDLARPDRPGMQYPLRKEGGMIMTREMCNAGCYDTYRMCAEHGDADACNTARNACDEGCLIYPPAETLPGYVPPGYVPPGYVAPGYDTPGYIIPGYETPGYLMPGDMTPPMVAMFCLDRCTSMRDGCFDAGTRPAAACNTQFESCVARCPFTRDLPPGYIPPPPISRCDGRCYELNEACTTDGRHSLAMCTADFTACIGACHEQGTPEAPDMPGSMDGNNNFYVSDTMITPPIPKREPPWFTDDNPPDPAVNKPAPSAVIDGSAVYQQDMPVYQPEEPAKEPSFFEKVWDFFAAEQTPEQKPVQKQQQ